MPAPARLASLQRLNNEDTADSWARYAGHRRQVTALAAAAPGGRLCLLGAGNCNDVDLAALAPLFDELHLVDLDGDALARARARQPATVQAKLALHAPVDLTGALHRLPAWRSARPSASQVDALPDRCVAHVVAALPGPFDAVVSTCLVTQIMRTCYVALGTAPWMTDVAAALALGHVRSLVALARPGGRGVVVTDVVSTESYPVDELLPARGAALLDEVVASGAAYAATAPQTLCAILDGEREQGRVGDVERVPPWLWTFSPERAYLAHAVAFSRRAQPA